MKQLTLTTCLLFAFLVSPCFAQEDDHSADREAMLEILGDIESSLNTRDVSLMLKHLHPEVIVTYQNGEATQGHDGLREYYTRMMEGGSAIVKEYSTVATVGAPAVFHGDTAAAFGKSVDSFVLVGGLEFALDSNWSTAMHKQDGQWRVISLHFSTNVFDNPILNNAKRLNWIAGGGGLLLGLLLMWLIGRNSKKSASA
jgi:hypothetical protein